MTQLRTDLFTVWLCSSKLNLADIREYCMLKVPPPCRPPASLHDPVQSGIFIHKFAWLFRWWLLSLLFRLDRLLAERWGKILDRFPSTVTEVKLERVHCTATALYFTEIYCTVFQTIYLYCYAFHFCTAFHYISLHCSALKFTVQ